MTEPDEGFTGTFWEHAEVLRAGLMKALAVTAACAVVAFLFKELLFAVVLAPKEADFFTYSVLERWGQCCGMEGVMPSGFSVEMINTGLANQFLIHVKTALYAGLVMASPYLIYLAFAFIAPALYRHERRYALRAVGAGYAMFLLGALLNYFLIFPLTFRFLGTYQVSKEVVNMISLDSYMNTLLTMTFMMGVVFEIPVLCWLLARLGWLKASFMQRYRKHAVVVILVAAAVITPTSDVFTLLLVGLPMMLLYEAGIGVVKMVERKG